MNQDDEKHRIKPRKKYARQVSLMNGKAIIVDPIEKKNGKGLGKENLDRVMNNARWLINEVSHYI